MPTFVWIICWIGLFATVTLLYVRERRSGRKAVGEVDRFSHEAGRQAGINAEGRGPNAQIPWS